MRTLAIVMLAAMLPLHAALAATPGLAPAAHAVAGQKIDSGLGELPHYRLWADPSGKNPLGQASVADVQDLGAAKSRHSANAKPTALESTELAGLK